jgi:hypothetical protein
MLIKNGLIIPHLDIKEISNLFTNPRVRSINPPYSTRVYSYWNHKTKPIGKVNIYGSQVDLVESGITTEWDISLFCLMFKFSKSIQPFLPTTNDKFDLLRNIKSLSNFRNQDYGHISCTSLDEVQFNNLITKIKPVLLLILSNIYDENSNEYKDIEKDLNETINNSINGDDERFHLLKDELNDLQEKYKAESNMKNFVAKFCPGSNQIPNDSEVNSNRESTSYDVHRLHNPSKSTNKKTVIPLLKLQIYLTNENNTGHKYSINTEVKIDKFISVEVPNDLRSEVKKSIACFYDKLK